MARLSIFYSLLSIPYLVPSAQGNPHYKVIRAAPASPATPAIPPSQDPWYSAPDGYESTAPGAVLKIRKSPDLESRKAFVRNCSDIYNILYRTTDSNYKPSWAVTTLFVPLANSSATTSTNTNSIKPLGDRLLSYQTSYDSASVDMSASYGFFRALPDPNVPRALGYGWYVNSPDYEGPLASFLAGVQSGHATIDSIRAVLNANLGVLPTASFATLGYSGGGTANAWAAELAVQYAPELTFAGHVLGGLVPNVTNAFEAVNETPGASDVPNGILGLTSQNKVATDYLMSQLSPTGAYNASAFLAARTQNTTVDAAQYANQHILNYFKSGAAFLQAPQLTDLIARDATLGFHGVPRGPVYAYKAINDELAPVGDTDKLISYYCEGGANVLYERNTVGGHLADAINGFEASFAFLRAVLEGGYEGVYQSRGCEVRNVTVTVDTSPE